MTLRTNAARPRQRWLALVVGVLALMLGASAVVLALISDGGTHDVTVLNSGFSSTADLGNATVEYIGSDSDNQSSGTGLFDPFVRLQGSPTEKGYNTNGPVAFETKSGKWTKAILASAIPQVDCDGSGSGTALCWELFVDINEGNNAKRVSLNEVEVWLTTNPNLVGYVDPTGFPAGTATQVYDFSGAILIHDVNQGSGRGDLRYLIPVQPFATGDFFVLYSKWGTTSGDAGNFGTGGYASEGGFEEWKVRKAPNLTITKTADAASVNAGTNIGFTITITNNGAADATGVTISDPLPAGTGIDWQEAPTDNPNCSISGSPPTETLNCGPVTLAAGGGSLSVHVQSATTGASCGTYNNTATFTSTNAGSGSASDTINVNCGAIQITKTAKHADTSGTSANLVATFTITGPSPSTATRTVTTGTDGIGCVGGLAFGSYNVAETTVPTGYDAPPATTVTVDNSANCIDATFAGESVSVENTPLTDVDIVVTPQHAGSTSTLVECWGPGSDPATDPPDYTATLTSTDDTLSIPDLEPTDPAITLNCQITVDP